MIVVQILLKTDCTLHSVKMHGFPFSSFVHSFVSGLLPFSPMKIICLIGTQDICIKGSAALNSLVSKTWKWIMSTTKTTNPSNERKRLTKIPQKFFQWTTYFCRRRCSWCCHRCRRSCCCFSFARWTNLLLGQVFFSAVVVMAFDVVSPFGVVQLFRFYAAQNLMVFFIRVVAACKTF